MASGRNWAAELAGRLEDDWSGRDGNFVVTGSLAFDHAEVYQLTSAGSTPTRASHITLGLLNAFHYTMPAYSVSTLVLMVPTGLTGDYNHNGIVDAADYTVWRDMLGSTSNLAADGNGNGIIDAGDYAVWRSHFGHTAGSGSFASGGVPEPATILLMVLTLVGFALLRTRHPTMRRDQVLNA
jgi:hypothetical protein